MDDIKVQVAITSFYTLMDQKYRYYRQNDNREGQAWMNALHEVMPDLYAKIDQTPADCFYDDSRVGLFKDIVFGGQHYAP